MKPKPLNQPVQTQRTWEGTKRAPTGDGGGVRGKGELLPSNRNTTLYSKCESLKTKITYWYIACAFEHLLVNLLKAGLLQRCSNETTKE